MQLPNFCSECCVHSQPTSLRHQLHAGRCGSPHLSSPAFGSSYSCRKHCDLHLRSSLSTMGTTCIPTSCDMLTPQLHTRRSGSHHHHLSPPIRSTSDARSTYAQLTSRQRLGIIVRPGQSPLCCRSSAACCVEVACLAAPLITVCQDGAQVSHSAARDEDGCFLADHSCCQLLKLVHGGIISPHIVPNLGL